MEKLSIELFKKGIAKELSEKSQRLILGGESNNDEDLLFTRKRGSH